jgi:NAD-dependent SIR2 family protein deacetylase
MIRLIDHIPRELLDDISSGECLPVVGAGFSRNAILPPECQMPLWNDLGAEFAKLLGMTFSGKPTDSLSCYCDQRGKLELARLLRKSLYINSARPGNLHTCFAKLPFKHVLTTNFDFLLEQAYSVAGKPYIPVVDEELLAFGQSNGETRLIKMHGDLHHPSLMVVTEEDYDKFRDNREAMFFEVTHLLSRHSVLFVGYSIDDPDFRQVWRLVDKHLRGLRRSSYVLLVGATVDEADTYRRRGVKTVISLPGTKEIYGRVLSEAFSQICEAISSSL